MNYWEAFDNLRGVRDELLAARFSLGRAIRSVDVDASLLREVGEPLKPAQLRACAENLEPTYLLRLFATYEWILRDYWAAVRPGPRPRRTKMEVLMNRVAVECSIPYDVLDDAHDVRKYRNELVHPAGMAKALDFDECKSRLGYFVSYLPRRW